MIHNRTEPVGSTPDSVVIRIQQFKGAALLDVGTTAGTVASGDDSRILGAAPLNSPTFTGTVGGITASMVGAQPHSTSLDAVLNPCSCGKRP